jgi:hypothetical protein
MCAPSPVFQVNDSGPAVPSTPRSGGDARSCLRAHRYVRVLHAGCGTVCHCCVIRGLRTSYIAVVAKSISIKWLKGGAGKLQGA